jgi:proline dehydrogenase
MLRTLFMSLSHSAFMRKVCTGFGPAQRIARRFIAGETLDEAMDVVARLNAEGIDAVLNHLGESVKSPDDARQASGDYTAMLERIHADSARATVSVKPTHLGLGFGEEVFRGNLKPVLDRADQLGLLVEMDMEDAPTTEGTLRVFHGLIEGHGRMRVALQAYLFRTAADVQRIAERGSSVRLVKGAYDEPSDVAWKTKKEVDASYARLIELCLSPAAMKAGFYPAFATHDHHLIEKIITLADRHDLGKDRFEFQMLLGVRRDWQQRLAEEGFRMRVYVPFGTQWYPYFMRRLAERPANVLFMARAMLGK